LTEIAERRSEPVLPGLPLDFRREEEFFEGREASRGYAGDCPSSPPIQKIGVRLACLFLLVLLSVLDHFLKPVYLQVLVDFLYFLPVLLASFFSLPDGLFFALAAAALSVFAAPARLRPDGSEAYLCFGTLGSGYCALAMLIDRFKASLVLRQRLERTLRLTTEAFLKALDLKDRRTGEHSRRVARYALAIAREMGLSRTDQELLFLAGLLHDLGKIGVAGRILNKPGGLTPEEWLEIKKHPIRGYGIVKEVTGSEELAKAVLYHHERYDGRGYPAGLKGEEIPFFARILCVADSYEAMTATRPYRPALPAGEALAELQLGAGGQFDPRVVEVFCRVLANSGRKKLLEER
jgi:putative nucleotidyltransferase with HDIG domain